MAYTNVKINNEHLKEMFSERVAFWDKDDITERLFNQYYDNLVDSGCFEGAELDIMLIVDNDIVNNYDVGTLEEIKKSFGSNFTEDNIIESLEDNGVTYVLYCAC